MSDTPQVQLDAAELRQKILLETARLAWPELVRHFARGVVVVVSARLDLVDVAACLAEDRGAQIQDWINRGWIRRASDDDGRRWDRQHREQGDAGLWAVVVRPWVLVQTATQDTAPARH